MTNIDGVKKSDSFDQIPNLEPKKLNVNEKRVDDVSKKSLEEKQVFVSRKRKLSETDLEKTTNEETHKAHKIFIGDDAKTLSKEGGVEPPPPIDEDKFIFDHTTKDITHDIHEELGAGSFKIVHKTYNRSLKIFEALATAKTPTENIDSAILKKTNTILRNEYLVCQELKHAGITGIVEYHSLTSTKSGAVGFLMQYCGKGDLEKLLRKRDRTEDESKELYGYLFKVATSLVQWEEKGFIHRDLKPANIFVTEEGKPLIGDFGMVTKIETQFKYCGTFNYMAPEVIGKFATENTTKQDAWSFGMMILEAETGYNFGKIVGSSKKFLDFVKDKDSETYYKIIDKLIEKKLSMIKNEDLRDCVQGMLRANPEERSFIADSLHTLDKFA